MSEYSGSMQFKNSVPPAFTTNTESFYNDPLNSWTTSNSSTPSETQSRVSFNNICGCYNKGDQGAVEAHRLLPAVPTSRTNPQLDQHPTTPQIRTRKLASVSSTRKLRQVPYTQANCTPTSAEPRALPAHIYQRIRSNLLISSDSSHSTSSLDRIRKAAWKEVSSN